MQINPKNERIKRRYLQWLEDAKGRDKKTTQLVAAALAAFEETTGGKDFAAFHIEQARRFKTVQYEKKNAGTGNPLSHATIRSRTNALKAFFLWLADQPGYKSRIKHADAEYFNLTEKQVRIASAHRQKPIPTIEQIRHVLEKAPSATPIEKRDRALIAFTLLSGMRDAAIASLPLGNVSIERQEISQDARLVETKNSKTMTTYFFPVGEDFVAIVSDWVAYLKTELMFADSDPLFPKTAIGLCHGYFAATGLAREYWSDAAAIRRIFRERFEAAGLSYFNPHSFRKTLIRLAYDKRLNPEQMKAWSQNLGHENLATSLMSYGTIADHRTGEIMRTLALKSGKHSEGGAGQGNAVPKEVLAWVAEQTKGGVA